MRTATLDRPDTLTSSRNQRCAGSVSAVMRMVPEGLSLSSLRAASSSSISSSRVVADLSAEGVKETVKLITEAERRRSSPR